MDPSEIETERELNPNQSDRIYHLAVDFGGSLVKLVYFTKNDDDEEIPHRMALAKSKTSSGYPVLKGRLQFKKFETSKINDCLEFIKSMKLHLGGCQQQDGPGTQITAVKATGGGAYKYADLFKERLGITLDKEDEMDCLVEGANFLLKPPPYEKSELISLGLWHVTFHQIPFLISASGLFLFDIMVVHQEAFTYMDGQKEFVQIEPDDLYPYLLVNIGSGVGILKVDGDGKFERVSGTSIGGGTFWGLGKLLTKCKSFDDLLELSYRGDNSAIDMLVGDIYGGMDYSKVGLSSTIIASSFGKAISDKKELEDYKPEDIARSLLRMISNNIGQISYLNALQFGVKRIFFSGFFIRSHPFTMDTLSDAVNFWSKGEAKAMFLRHEGFLGAVGAFMSSYKQDLHELLVDQVDAVNKTQASLDLSIDCTIYAA